MSFILSQFSPDKMYTGSDDLYILHNSFRALDTLFSYISLEF